MVVARKRGPAYDPRRGRPREAYFAEHRQIWSHDTIRDFLKEDEVRPSDLWKRVNGEIVQSPLGYILFDDTVLDKNYSKRQWH